MTSRAWLAAISLLLDQAAGARSLDEATASGGSEQRPVVFREYDVQLLFARPGLSCTNVAKKWISRPDAGRANMLDPHLAGLGRNGSRQAGADVAAWLQARSQSVDALFSSGLLRAMETGLLMYPEAGPLHVAPYVSHTSVFNRNKPYAQQEQVGRLVRSIRRPFHVDYKWANGFGPEGSWPEFLHFLQHVFLPDFTRTLPTHKGMITLAVVTHSLDMMESDVGRECKSFWTSQGVDEPLNNQVLRLAYKFSTRLPSPDAADVTPKHFLVAAAQKCEQVSAGLRLKGSDGKVLTRLCLSDVGEFCIAEIAMHSWWSSTLWEATLEKTIVDLIGAVAEVEEKCAEAAAETQMVALRYNTSCLADGPQGPPRAPCQTLWADLRKSSNALATLRLEYYQKHYDLIDLLNTECRAGGKPNPMRYVDLAALRLGARAQELAELASSRQYLQGLRVPPPP